MAERLAWKIVGEQSRWDLVVVNPGLVLGPGLSRHTNAEGVLILRDFGNGYYRFGILRAQFGDGYPFPRQTVSKPVALMLAPRRRIPQAVAKRNVGYRLRFDNGYAREALGLIFRPAAESVVDHFRQLLDDGLVPRPKRSRRGSR